MSGNIREEAQKASKIISDSGGELVGRTRLQKVAFLLEVMGFGEGFQFQYKHYGPYSEELTSSVGFARAFGLIEEEERPAAWGGYYSIFKSFGASECTGARKRILQLGVEADPVELELAATAVFLAQEGVPDAWRETQRRKADKAGAGRLANAKRLLAKFRECDEQGKIPELN